MLNNKCGSPVKSRQIDGEIWLAIRERNVALAIALTDQWYVTDGTAEQAFLLATIVGACPNNGTAPLGLLAQKMPPKLPINPNPALNAIARLARASVALDLDGAMSSIRAIRMHGPSTDRAQLHLAVNTILKANDGLPDKGRSYGFRLLSAVISPARQ